MTTTPTMETNYETRRTTGAVAPNADRRDATRPLVDERVAQWSPEATYAAGDSHDKGEPSLCVGEAA